MERMRELIALLNEAAMRYEQFDEEIISNYEYDRLYDELVELENETGVVLPESPTQKVGYVILSGLKKVQHDSQMLSLDKTKDIEKLKSFLAADSSEVKRSILFFKLDGLTIVLRYINGALDMAVTRGNGITGEDITHNAKVFKNIPRKISYEGELVIRGEAVIGFSEFERINENLPVSEKYKNPRNLCSGTVRQLNSGVCADRNVRFFAFTLVKSDVSFQYKSEQMEWLRNLGFSIVENELVTEENIESAVKEFKKKAAANEYGSDGLVLTYDDISFGNSLGATSKFPRNSIAFKWADTLSETVLIDIVWNTSRTGMINPVAVFEPVELEGTTVNRASIHNVSIIKGLQLGLGDVISVYKANMIIPQIADNITRSGSYIIPDKCPACGEPAEIIKQNEVEVLFCKNPDCIAKLVSALTHFASRDAMNIEGFSQSTIEKFISKGFIHDYTDIYMLEAYKDEIIKMEGFGKKSYEKLIVSINASRKTDLAKFIYALGIGQVGLSNAKLLCSFYDYDIERVKSAGIEELTNIEGFGEVIAKSVATFFSDEKNLSLLEKALSFLEFEKPVTGEKTLLSGLTFVITGDLNEFKNRNELTDLIEAAGGKVQGSVSKKTDYLINNDVESLSSKNKKAKELDVPIINEADFKTLFGMSD